MLYYQERSGAGEPATIDLPFTYEGLKSFFAQKIKEDIEEHRKNPLFRLQHYLFEARHGELGLTTLCEVYRFARELEEQPKIEPKLMLLELRYEFNKRFARREEQLNLGHIVKVCNRVDQANEQLHQIIRELNRFWTAFLKE
jgi:hypothetical protein